MNIFDILNIEPTKDEMVIKQAYLTKLSETNPEDKPEEFMMLRDAYEKALEYANIEEQDQIDEDDLYKNDEIKLWIKKVEKVYKNFKTRNDEAAWKELLNDDICQNIDTKNDAREALLVFFMKNYYIPSNVMRILNEFFDFIGDLNELYEYFPREFIDNIVLDGVKYDEYPKYSLFNIDENLDYDSFLDDFYDMNRSYRDGNLEEAKNLVQKLKSSDIKHPELYKKEALIYYHMNEQDKAWDTILDIEKKYSYDLDLDLIKGMILADKGENEDAKSYYKKCLEKDSENFVAVEGLCQVYKNEGNLIEAKRLICDLHLNGYRDDDTEGIRDDINDEILKKFELIEDVNSLSPEFLLEVADIYFYRNKMEKTIQIIESIEFDQSFDILYYYLLSKINTDESKYQKAEDTIKLWEEAIKNSSEEKLEKFKGAGSSMSEVYAVKTILNWNKEDYDKALECINKSIEFMPKNINALTTKMKLLFDMKKYEEVVKLSEKILELSPRYATAYMAKIECLYRLDFYTESYEACNDMLEINPYHLFAYIYKIYILIQVDEIDEAKDIIEFLHKEEVELPELEYFEARIMSKEGNEKEAENIYKNLIGKIENENLSLEFVEDLYLYYIEMIFYTHDDDEILKLCDSGLKYDEKNQGLLYYKGLALYYKGELDESKSVYEYLEEEYPNNSYSNLKLGDIYKVEENYNKALEYYNKQIELNYSITDYFRRVDVNFEILDMESIYEDLIYLDKNLPENPKVYEYFGKYYNILDQTQKSYDYFIKSKELYRESDEYEESDELNTNLGIVCSKLGKKEEAIKYYIENYENTKDIDDLDQLYNIYVTYGEFEKAMELLREIFKIQGISKLSSEYFHKMGHINWEMKNMKEAIKYFSLIVNPDNWEKREKARLMYYTGKSKKALKLIKEVIKDLEFVHDNRFNYMIAAKICLDLNDTDQAKYYANKIIRKTPLESIDSKIDEIPHVYRVLGEAYILLGEFEKAELYLKKALDSPRCAMCADYRCTDALSSLAYLEYVRGDIGASEDYIRQTLEVDDSCTDAIGLAYKIGMLK